MSDPDGAARLATGIIMLSLWVAFANALHGDYFTAAGVFIASPIIYVAIRRLFREL